MFLLKLFGRIILIPIMLALTLIQWIGIFLNSISSVIFRIMAFIFALTGIASMLFGLASGQDALKTIIIGFAFFIIPSIGDGIITMIDAANSNIRAFILDDC